MVMRAELDARDLQRALRTLAPEIAKATSKRMREVSKEVRDDVRKKYPVGPNIGGHAYRAITSGASGVVPYVALATHSDRYPYIGWLEFGGRRPNDTRARPRVQGGRWFFPRVGQARKQVLRDVEEIVVDVIRAVGLE